VEVWELHWPMIDTVLDRSRSPRFFDQCNGQLSSSSIRDLLGEHPPHKVKAVMLDMQHEQNK
jgi:hypothetical protein